MAFCRNEKLVHGGAEMKIEGMSSAGINSYTPEVVNNGYTPDISSEPVEVVEQPMIGSELVPKNAPSENTIKQAVSDINKRINPNTVARYGFHDDTNRVTIKIVDKNSDKVIKEFPAEETLDMIAKVWELAGVFLDERG